MTRPPEYQSKLRAQTGTPTLMIVYMQSLVRIASQACWLADGASAENRNGGPDDRCPEACAEPDDGHEPQPDRPFAFAVIVHDDMVCPRGHPDLRTENAAIYWNHGIGTRHLGPLKRARLNVAFKRNAA